MKKSSSLISAVFLFFVLAASSGAQQLTTVSDQLPPQLQAALPSGVTFAPGTPILRTAEHIGGALILAPALDGMSTISSLITAPSNSSNLIIEALIILPPAPTPAPAAAPPFDTASQLERLGLLFNQFSSLQGIQYWSGSRKIMRTFYTAAYRVDNPKDQKKLQDPSTVAEFLALLPKTAYIYQKDQTFDGLVTEVKSTLTPSTFYMTNVSAIPYRLIGIPVLPAGGLENGFLAAPSAQGTLLYFVTTMKPPFIGKNRVFESASNKALALLHWFISTAASQNLIATATIPWNIDEIPPEIRLGTSGK